MFSEAKVDYTKPAAPEDLQGGDILVSLEGAPPAKSLFNDDDLGDIGANAQHGAIYISNNHIVHTAIGKKVKNVAVHSLEKVAESFGPGNALGRVLVFRCRDAKIQNILFTLAEQYSKLLSDTFRIPYGTRFAEIESKNEAVYRAARAAHRLDYKIEISKLKGVSCSNFVSYMLKAAILKLLFPNGLPESIANILNEIENIRKANKPKKLDSVDPKHLEKFVDTFEAECSKLIQSGTIDPTDYKMYREALSRAVKSKTIDTFCTYALTSPLLETGYLYYDKETNKPRFMSHATFVAVSKKLKAQRGCKYFAADIAAAQKTSQNFKKPD